MIFSTCMPWVLLCLITRCCLISCMITCVASEVHSLHICISSAFLDIRLRELDESVYEFSTKEVCLVLHPTKARWLLLHMAACDSNGECSPCRVPNSRRRCIKGWRYPEIAFSKWPRNFLRALKRMLFGMVEYLYVSDRSESYPQTAISGENLAIAIVKSNRALVWIFWRLSFESQWVSLKNSPKVANGFPKCNYENLSHPSLNFLKALILVAVGVTKKFTNGGEWISKAQLWSAIAP